MKRKLYYDGLCRLCSREIQHYYSLRGAPESIEFVDISAAEFDATAEGVDPVAVDESLHLKLTDGRIVTGVEAFVELWKVLPRYEWLAGLASYPLVQPFLRWSYACFARIRLWLPKRQVKCEVPLRSPSVAMARTNR